MKKYEKIYALLKTEILSGAYPYGARLPSKRTLAEENGVSRQSVSDALAATRKKLDFYEKNLKIYSAKREINAIIDGDASEEIKLQTIKNLVGEV